MGDLDFLENEFMKLLSKEKPDHGQDVIWIWYSAGQVVAGDFYEGKPRDASRNYEVIVDNLPSHWMEWPSP